MDKERPRHKGDGFIVRHPAMDLTDRAKIFAPFAAIKWDEVVKRTEEKNFDNIISEIEHIENVEDTGFD